MIRKKLYKNPQSNLVSKNGTIFPLKNNITCFHIVEFVFDACISAVFKNISRRLGSSHALWLLF